MDKSMWLAMLAQNQNKMQNWPQGRLTDMDYLRYQHAMTPVTVPSPTPKQMVMEYGNGSVTDQNDFLNKLIDENKRR